MPLKPYRECQQESSPSARFCPNCGAEKPYADATEATLAHAKDVKLKAQEFLDGCARFCFVLGGWSTSVVLLIVFLPVGIFGVIVMILYHVARTKPGRSG